MKVVMVPEALLDEYINTFKDIVELRGREMDMRWASDGHSPCDLFGTVVYHVEALRRKIKESTI
jgi:hypothetical protein